MTHALRTGILCSLVVTLLLSSTARTAQKDDKPLTEKDLEKLWEEMASDDAAKAFQAMVRMANSSKESTTFLKSKVKPVQPVDPKVLTGLLDGLDDTQYQVRQKASAELEKLADLAAAGLRSRLDAKPSLETRKRIEALLDKLDGPVTQPDLLRNLRAVELLELIGTAESCDVLRPIAKGAEGHRVTEAAQGSVKRLDKRLKQK